MDAQVDAKSQMNALTQVETMVIQAIGLLDNLDKEVNTYAMRAREWYGRHFPELDRILQDNILYAKSVKLMGDRVNASNIDFSQILSEEVEAELKEAAVISMGTVVSDLDLKNIMDQCDLVLSLSQCRALLSNYLKSRMNRIAPNLTTMVGELVGARLIAHKGSLVNLAKQPGSKIQVLGAGKALSGALNTNQATSKHGLIYCAPLVAQCSQPKTKGRFCRSLAAKTALAIRYDAFRDNTDNTMGLENRAKLEARLRDLKDREGRELSKSAEPKIEVCDKDRKGSDRGLITSAKTYNPAADSTLGQALDAAATGNEETDTKKEKKKKKKKSSETEEQTPAVEEKEKKMKKKSDEDGEGETAKEKKKKDKEEKVVEDAATGNEETDTKKEKKKKKKKSSETEEQTPAVEEKEKKMKKKSDEDGEGETAKEKKKKKDKEEKVVEDGEKSKKKKKGHKDVEEEEAEQTPSKKKDKTKTKKKDKEENVVEDGEKSKKKKRKHADVEEEAATEQTQSKKKDKKKKKKSEE